MFRLLFVSVSVCAFMNKKSSTDRDATGNTVDLKDQFNSHSPERTLSKTGR